MALTPDLSGRTAPGTGSTHGVRRAIAPSPVLATAGAAGGYLDEILP